jgi:hypothetical protein
VKLQMGAKERSGVSIVLFSDSDEYLACKCGIHTF